MKTAKPLQRKTPLKPGKGFDRDRIFRKALAIARADKASPARQDRPQRVKTLPAVPTVPPPPPRASMGPAALTAAPKHPVVASRRLRDSAKGEHCTVRLPWVCLWPRTDTTVLAHSNHLADGKGMGRKACDTRGAFACFACHDVIDGRAPRPAGVTLAMVEDCFYAGVAATRQRQRDKGLLP